MNSPECFKLSPWTKVSFDQCVLGQKSSWNNVHWTKWSLDNCPMDKCINTKCGVQQILSKKNLLKNNFGPEKYFVCENKFLSKQKIWLKKL